MTLRTNGTVEIPGAAGSSFDHGAYDAKTRRIFVAHTGRDCVDVIDHDDRRRVATLDHFKEAAGVVADDGIVLVISSWRPFAGITRSSSMIATPGKDNYPS